MDRGLVVETGPPEDLFEHPREERTKRFLDKILASRCPGGGASVSPRQRVPHRRHVSENAFRIPPGDVTRCGRKPMTFDLVIRNAECATATDVWRSDIGIFQGRIEAIGRGLAGARREIDAEGRLVLPGGIDPHCHIDQLTSQGLRTADNFASGTISAAFGGTTTILSFAVQPRRKPASGSRRVPPRRRGQGCRINHST